MVTDQKITVVNMRNHKIKSCFIRLLTKINSNRIQAAANSQSKSTTSHPNLEKPDESIDYNIGDESDDSDNNQIMQW